MTSMYNVKTMFSGGDSRPPSSGSNAASSSSASSTGNVQSATETGAAAALPAASAGASGRSSAATARAADNSRAPPSRNIGDVLSGAGKDWTAKDACVCGNNSTRRTGPQCLVPYVYDGKAGCVKCAKKEARAAALATNAAAGKVEVEVPKVCRKAHSANCPNSQGGLLGWKTHDDRNQAMAAAAESKRRISHTKIYESEKKVVVDQSLQETALARLMSKQQRMGDDADDAAAAAAGATSHVSVCV